LKELHLPTVRDSFHELAEQARADSLSYEQYLSELLERECEVRLAHRVQRLLLESKLPPDKTMDSFQLSRLPLRTAQQVRSLLDGGFVERKENLLAFGNPGSGKTHLLCAICHELVRQGRRALYVPCCLLVQELLAAKRDLALPRMIKRIARYEAILIDDLGYVQQTREEMEVLFTLLAERYERGSVLITSNLPFSKWESIFKDPMTTAAAIDRLVHHCVIVELNLTSYRMQAADKRKQPTQENATKGGEQSTDE
jgi:DNA replication protein DnaC